MNNEFLEANNRDVDLLAATIAIGSLWRHYLTEGTYRVVDLRLRGRTGDPEIVYTSVDNPHAALRQPLLNWLEIVEYGGEQPVRRFRQVD